MFYLCEELGEQGDAYPDVHSAAGLLLLFVVHTLHSAGNWIMLLLPLILLDLHRTHL